MKHLYKNNDGEVVAADSAQQATQFHDVELAGEPANADDWTQIPNDKVITAGADDGPPGYTETHTAAEWAGEHLEPAIVFTTYT
ncbi:MAG: hypothetical protein AAGD32_17395 [Planctomycetota bacterium]